jgi:hypothetical protein
MGKEGFSAEHTKMVLKQAEKRVTEGNLISKVWLDV